MLIRKGRARECAGLAIAFDIGQRKERAGLVGGVEFEVARPLEPKLVELVVGYRGVPVGDDEPFVSGTKTVIARSAIAYGGRRIEAEGLLPILQVGKHTEVVFIVQLIIQLGETDVLDEIPREGAKFT